MRAGARTGSPPRARAPTLTRSTLRRCLVDRGALGALVVLVVRLHLQGTNTFPTTSYKPHVVKQNEYGQTRCFYELLTGSGSNWEACCEAGARTGSPPRARAPTLTPRSTLRGCLVDRGALSRPRRPRRATAAARTNTPDYVVQASSSSRTSSEADPSLLRALDRIGIELGSMLCGQARALATARARADAHPVHAPQVRRRPRRPRRGLVVLVVRLALAWPWARLRRTSRTSSSRTSIVRPRRFYELLTGSGSNWAKHAVRAGARTGSPPRARARRSPAYFHRIRRCLVDRGAARRPRRPRRATAPARTPILSRLRRRGRTSSSRTMPGRPRASTSS